jgi:hypothetical protein
LNQDEIIQLISLVLQYGVPAVQEAVAAFKGANAGDPTSAEILALIQDLKKPEDY